MVLFFFYNKLTENKLLKKINHKFEIKDDYGYILVNKYNSDNNILEISNDSNNNNVLLYGKIVDFDMSLYQIIHKINNIEECRLKYKNTKYTVTTVDAFSSNNQMYNVYIIY